MNKQFSKLEKIILLGFSLLVGIVFVYLTNNSYNTQVKEVAFANKDTEIEGVVDRTLPVKGSVKIWFKDGRKTLIHAGFNYNYNYIIDFLKRNDSLVKHSGSDTVFIYRASKEYIFLLNKDIDAK